MKDSVNVNYVEPSEGLKKMMEQFPVIEYGKPLEALIVGGFRLVRMGPGKIWIGEAKGGEGGEFKESDIEAVISKFYADNF